MEFLYGVLIILVLYIGYLISLYSTATYIEPEKIEELSLRVSGFRRKYLKELSGEPKISLQLTVICKSLIVIIASLLMILLVERLVDRFNLPRDIFYIIGLFLVWALNLIFVEIFPRRRVLGSEDKHSFRFISLFVSIYILLKPIIKIYDRTFQSEKIEKVPEDQKEDLIERAIETLAEQSGVAGRIVDKDEKEMIGQIFLLDITEVREVMVPRIDMKGIEKSCSVEDIRKYTKDLGFSRYPVYDGSPDNILGILYIKDLFTGLSTNEDNNFDITRYLRTPYFIPESKKISALLAEFKSNKIHMAVIVDEYGGTSGLVTLEDILEEIVGEIQDEHDHEIAPLKKLPDGSFRVNAGLSIEEFIDELNLEYETDEFETVGGMIYDLVGSVPTAGTTLRWKDVIFEVERVEGQRIVSVKAWLKKGPEAPKNSE